MRTRTTFGTIAAMSFAALGGIANGQDTATAHAARCSQVEDPQQRLACFDSAFPKDQAPALVAIIGAEPVAGNPTAVQPADGSSGGGGDADFFLKAEAVGSYLAVPEASRGVAAGGSTTGDLSSSLSTFAPMLEIGAGFELDYGDRFRFELRGFYSGIENSSTSSVTDFGFGAYGLAGIQGGSTASTGFVTIAPGQVELELDSGSVFPSSYLQFQEAMLTGPTPASTNSSLSQSSMSAGSPPGSVGVQIQNTLQTDGLPESARGIAFSATEQGYDLLVIGDIGDRLSVTSGYESSFSYWGMEATVAAEFETGAGLIVSPSFGPVYRGINQDVTSTTTVSYATNGFGTFSLDSETQETFRTTYLGAGAGLSIEKQLENDVALTLGLSGGALGAFTEYGAREDFSASVRVNTIDGSAALEDHAHTIALFGRVNVGAAIPVGPGEFSIGGQFDYLSAIPVGTDDGVEVAADNSGSTRSASGEVGSLGSEEALRHLEYRPLFGYGLNAGYHVRF